MTVYPLRQTSPFNANLRSVTTVTREGAFRVELYQDGRLAFTRRCASAEQADALAQMFFDHPRATLAMLEKGAEKQHRSLLRQHDSRLSVPSLA